MIDAILFVLAIADPDFNPDRGELAIYCALAFLTGAAISQVLDFFVFRLMRELKAKGERASFLVQFYKMREQDRKDSAWRLQKQMAFTTTLAVKGWPCFGRYMQR